MSDREHCTAERDPTVGPLSARAEAVQTHVLEVGFDLQRCHHRLHRLRSAVRLPAFIHEMGEDRVPHDLAAHVYAVISAVMDEELREAVKQLFAVSHVTEDELRLDFLRHQRREEGKKS